MESRIINEENMNKSDRAEYKENILFCRASKEVLKISRVIEIVSKVRFEPLI